MENASLNYPRPKPGSLGQNLQISSVFSLPLLKAGARPQAPNNQFIESSKTSLNFLFLNRETRLKQVQAFGLSNQHLFRDPVAYWTVLVGGLNGTRPEMQPNCSPASHAGVDTEFRKVLHLFREAAASLQMQGWDRF